MTLQPSPPQPWALPWRQQPRRTRRPLLLRPQQAQWPLTQQGVLQGKQSLELFPMSALELYPEQRPPVLELSQERRLPALGRAAQGPSLAWPPALGQRRARPPVLGQRRARPPAPVQCLVQCLVQLLAPVLGLEGNLTRTPGLGLPAPAPQEGRSLKPEQQTPTQGWQVDRARARACT